MATATPRAATAAVPAAAFFALRCSASSAASIQARCNSAAARLSGLLRRIASHRRLHFSISRLETGKVVRYLLTGLPGTGRYMQNGIARLGGFQIILLTFLHHIHLKYTVPSRHRPCSRFGAHIPL
mmetsp:Transcript_39024/g.79885  ORF Transcript_39024/g.79885 Transcript_39024/m.79885 type:complete len:126 (-) Transcript_39024:125-502(-)